MTVVPSAPVKLPFVLRKNIRDNFDAKRGEFTERFRQITGTDYELCVDWAKLYEKLRDNADYGERLGEAANWYFDSLADNLERALKDDDMCREEFVDATEKRQFHLRLDDSISDSYNETRVADGILWILVQPNAFAYNCNNVGNNIIEALSANSVAPSDKPAQPEPSAPATPALPKSLPLALRKNIRDEFINKQGELLQRMKDATGGTVWTFAIDWEALYNGTAADNSYRERWGEAAYWYLDGFSNHVERLCKDDDMCTEALVEAASTHEVHIRLVE
ncbi:hypothetical protein THASP1DRAFT_22694, partial [Thamnocephalis sphaerospora]